MVDSTNRVLCPEEKVNALMAAVKADKARGLRELEVLLPTYSTDPRLHFLKGSWLAGQGDYAPARIAMRRAIDLAPDYAIARFQLGLLELTCGEPFVAQETWGPLHALPRNHYLRSFVTGLCHLIGDEFVAAVRCFEDGILLNHENQPMNHDMQLIANEVRAKLRGQKAGEGAISSAALLLQQAALKSRH